ncbi:hypothetical protein F0U44_09080 [Nocardioides humilatus]|uniref:Uncharacterized protein n=1 Tax=Nocardioides humilatus TaxID=2607660 RepID=A0A5B1LDC0_9ACTN|nr:hypothetical protein [Nocardioides humilatus]KAA1418642.1 hypothetical protein F0U44_09080 [Nocardioides humilatus]
MSQLVRIGQTISEWPVSSQQQARRNAMVALTDCARRRAEREDVASYLAERASRHAEPDVTPATEPGVSLHA